MASLRAENEALCIRIKELSDEWLDENRAAAGFLARAQRAEARAVELEKVLDGYGARDLKEAQRREEILVFALRQAQKAIHDRLCATSTAKGHMSFTSHHCDCDDIRDVLKHFPEQPQGDDVPY